MEVQAFRIAKGVSLEDEFVTSSHVAPCPKSDGVCGHEEYAEWVRALKGYKAFKAA